MQVLPSQNPSCLPLFTPISLLRSKATSSGRMSPCQRCQSQAMKHGKEFRWPQDAALLPHPVSAGRSRLGSKVVLHASLSHRSLPLPPRQPGLQPQRCLPGFPSNGPCRMTQSAAFLPAACPACPASRQPPAPLPPSSGLLPPACASFAAALPEAAHGRTLLGAAAGRRGRLHRCPAHPGQQPPVQVRARGVPPLPSPPKPPAAALCCFPAAPSPPCWAIGARSGSSGQLVGPTWLFQRSPHSCRGVQACPGVAHPGQPSSLPRRGSSRLCPSRLCPQAWCQQGKEIS